MLEIPLHPRYHENLERTGNGDDMPCVICGKGVKSPRFVVRVWYGTQIVTEEEACGLVAQEQAEGNGSGDLDYFPVGYDCLRKYPECKPYVQPV